MKKNFCELTDKQCKSFQPLFFMVMLKIGASEYEPVRWEDGRFIITDVDDMPRNDDPFEVYGKDEAMKYIAEHTIYYGGFYERTQNISPETHLFRLVPVTFGRNAAAGKMLLSDLIKSIV